MRHSHHRFRLLLKQRGHKVTPARLAILAALAATKKPLNAEAILAKIKEHRFNQATMYRTLATLKDAELIRQVDFQQGHALYELAARAEHHHVICTRCERVEDVTNCCAADMEQAALQQSGFAAVTRHSLEFFGVCQRCAIKTS